MFERLVVKAKGVSDMQKINHALIGFIILSII